MEHAGQTGASSCTRPRSAMRSASAAAMGLLCEAMRKRSIGRERAPRPSEPAACVQKFALVGIGRDDSWQAAAERKAGYVRAEFARRVMQRTLDDGREGLGRTATTPPRRARFSITGRPSSRAREAMHLQPFHFEIGRPGVDRERADQAVVGVLLHDVGAPAASRLAHEDRVYCGTGIDP